MRSGVGSDIIDAVRGHKRHRTDDQGGIYWIDELAELVELVAIQRAGTRTRIFNSDSRTRGRTIGGRYAMSTATAAIRRESAFDVSRCVVFDLEVYRGRWLVGFLGNNLDGELTDSVVDGDANALRRYMDHFVERGRTLVGYDGSISTCR